MALHTIKNSAEQKGKPAFLHFDKPSKESLKPNYINVNLNDVMKNIGASQFTYDTFKAAYDSDSSIEEYVDNFNSPGIEINTGDSDLDDVPNRDADNSVASMAKAATDLDDSSLG
jgi:hypothetical protein